FGVFFHHKRYQCEDGGAQTYHDHCAEAGGLAAVLAFEPDGAADGKRHQDPQPKFKVRFYFHARMFARKLGRIRYNFLTLDRKSTRLNSSHVKISYAVFCLKKK